MMTDKMKFLILGAGPAGLSFANALLEKGITDFLVLEKETEAGGLCRSKNVDGSPLDIGGGHFLDVRRPKVTEFLFHFMPESEWNLFNRDSRIAIENNVIGHPFEANIWQMDKESQKEYLSSIANAGCNTGKPIPEKFIDWIYWKLGDKITENYMLPYNRKMFGQNLNELGTYWLDKLPNVSYEETKLSCQNKKPYGKQPGHAQFYYPKEFGYGELWLRMGETIKQNVEYGKQVNYIDFNNHIVKTSDGSSYHADIIISTIPWVCFSNILGMPDNIKELIRELKSSSVQIAYYSENLDTNAHWIYYPDPELSYHRILVRHNFLPKSKGYWTETNAERVHISKKESDYKHINDFAYPLNTIQKPQIMNTILTFARENNVYGLGRWGEHQHYNSDKVVELAMDMADRVYEIAKC